ncbi:MAG: urate hydroxylase PuuD [Myxococcales bacterium]|nr:urate hydroxylase PuuD [Myxococcota bacterium]MDW8282861.1 urate hydroxylase PuuD [Myxococcales bacterium]
MDPTVREWLHIGFRWLHLVAGIMWIGNSLFFSWLDRHIQPPPDRRPGVEGELWMVHSGGFYQVEKKLVAPERMPPLLHWFKWEAGFTWLSGLMLLVLVYYMGGGAYLLDPAVSGIGPGAATAMGIGTLVMAWPLYDGLVRSPLGRSGWAIGGLGFLLTLGVAWGLSRVLSGRAAFLHTGAMLGTLMAANVWMRIIPAQRHLVAAVQAGRAPDPEQARAAKQRSMHNHYMTFPLLFVMLSNHFPSVYGHRYGWLVLSGLMLLGAGVRYYMNLADRSPRLLLGLVLSAVPMGVLVSLLLPAARRLEGASSAPAGAPSSGQSLGGPQRPPPGIGADRVGSIHGIVRLAGSAPERKRVVLPSGCVEQHRGPVFDNSVLVDQGRLMNAFVYISEGIGTWPWPPPRTEVVIDQRGCIYQPRVVGVQIGQDVAILNSDPIVHNVRAVADSNAPFNEIMVNRDSRLLRRFEQAEVMVHLKCDIHPWMGAFIGVVAHPYFAVSGPQGAFTLRNVPAGEHTLSAWHEVYGRLSQRVTVEPGSTTQVEFTFRP